MVYPHNPGNANSRISDLIVQAAQWVDRNNLGRAQQLLTEATELGYRSLGPANELTLHAQAELAFVLLYMEDGEGALRNGREAFLMAKKHFGPNDEVTTVLAYRMLTILMATSDFEKCITFEQENLHWLLTANPVNLTRRQLEVRQGLDELFKGNQ